MKYRTIKPEEQERAIFILSQAFFYDCKDEYERLKKNQFQPQDFVAAFNDNDDMEALLLNEPQRMWLDGVSVKSKGIGCVASLAEHRRGGNIRKLMKLVCDTMYDDGYVMSYLYPFSHQYYRKFGYELCCNAKNITANPKDLLRFKVKGYAKQYIPGKNESEFDDIVSIYNKFASKYNIMCDRKDRLWEEKLDYDPVKKTTRTYILYDENNSPQSYIVYSYKHKDVIELRIKDMAWTNPDSMYSMLGFIGKLYGNVKRINFDVPPEMSLEYVWLEPSDITTTTTPNGMARIVNAKRALEILRKPTTQGDFTIKINDEFMEQNNKSYKVSWQGSKTIVEEYSGDTDIECSIMALAQILTGFRSLDVAIYRDDLIVNDNMTLLNKVFVKKSVFITDHF